MVASAAAARLGVRKRGDRCKPHCTTGSFVNVVVAAAAACNLDAPEVLLAEVAVVYTAWGAPS